MKIFEKTKELATGVAGSIGETADKAVNSSKFALGIAVLELSGASVCGVYTNKLMEKPEPDELSLGMGVVGTAVLAATGLANWMIYRSEADPK